MASKILYFLLMSFFFFQVSTGAPIAKFILYTPGNQSPEIITAENPSRTFNQTLKLTIIVHGYWQNGGERWIKDMRTELMKRQKMNILVVDWGQGSGFRYNTAVQNTPKVGSDIAKLIRSLRRRHNYDVTNVHVIGHSLGAHVAGFAGAQMRLRKGQTLGRITGLDPASPDFNHGNMSARLDPSDAQFVDVIHSDIGLGGLGLARPCGHVDFYPNGGDNQPGCAMSGDLTDFHPVSFITRVVGNLKSKFPLKWQLICDHMKVLGIFTASINANCSRTSSLCGSWQKYTQGLCSICKGRACAEMGYNADQSSRGRNVSFEKYYLMTTNKYPFCGVPLYIYHVKILKVELRGYSFFGGSSEIQITLTGSNGVTMTTQSSDVIDNTRKVTQTIVSHVNLGKLTSFTILHMGSRTIYVGGVEVQGPENKYIGQYNKELSAPFFSIFSQTKKYTTSLRRTT